MILWTLIISSSHVVKYVTIALHLDNVGGGGIFARMAVLRRMQGAPP